MAATYKPVIWNRHKRIYDVLLIAGIATYLAIFIAVGYATGDSEAASVAGTPRLLRLPSASVVIGARVAGSSKSPSFRTTASPSEP